MTTTEDQDMTGSWPVTPTPSTEASFDGCRRECRQHGTHTMRYDACALAEQPAPRPPHVWEVGTAADGGPSVWSRPATQAELLAALTDKGPPGVITLTRTGAYPHAPDGPVIHYARLFAGERRLGSLSGTQDDITAVEHLIADATKWRDLWRRAIEAAEQDTSPATPDDMNALRLQLLARSTDALRDFDMSEPGDGASTRLEHDPCGWHTTQYGSLDNIVALAVDHLQTGCTP